MTDFNKCNGWTNYPTWCVSLWLGDDVNPLNFFDVDDIVARLANGDRSGLIYDFAEELRNMVDEVQEQTESYPGGMFVDLMRYALEQVDYYQIAENALDDMEV